MTETPLVTIITPTYNHVDFIGQCIESVLAQTYPHWEQIIIDDGSTDKTGKIVECYKDKRIRYIKQSNLGISKLGITYNKALKYSKGELIAVLEGDDFWPPYKLERQLPIFENPEVVLSFGKRAITECTGKKIIGIGPNIKWWDDNITKLEVLKKLLFQNFIRPSTVICRKNALIDIGGFKQPPGTFFVDYPTWLEICLIGKPVFIDCLLGCWRRHGSQVSTTEIIQMAKGNKFLIDFYNRLPAELKNSLGISIEDILRNYQHRLASAYFRVARRALIEGSWDDARKNLMFALAKGSYITKTRSLMGLVCSYIKSDLEWVATIMGEPRLK